MVAYKHLVPDPVFERDGMRYVRLGEGATLLKHIDGAAVTGFHGAWRPVSLYTGLACMSFLTLEQPGAKATWMLTADGRRLGDKLADLTQAKRSELCQEAFARGLDRLQGLIGDGIQLIDPALLGGIMAMAADARRTASEEMPEAMAVPAKPTLAMLAAPHRLEAHLRARPGEPGLRLGQGFSADGRAVGSLSLASTGVMPAASRYLLTLSIGPAQADGGQAPADIEVVANGAGLGSVRLDAHWQAEGADFAFWLPAERVAGKELELAFRHTKDFMLTALRLECGRSIGTPLLAPGEIMLRFENIGDNCEFGLVQRHYGAEPVGLLRFAGLRNPRRLVRFLEDEFGRFGEPGSLSVTIIGGEYWITDHSYGIAYHTFRYPGEVDAAEVIRENEIKVSYLKRKFREDLEDGEKILVYKRVVTQDPHEILALHAALNRFGTVNPLLWVTEADTRHPPGTVEWIGAKLLKGHVGRISLENAHDFDAETWLLLCRNALAAFEGSLPT